MAMDEAGSSAKIGSGAAGKPDSELAEDEHREYVLFQLVTGRLTLPVRQLIQLRCVSKLWAQSHYTQNKNQTAVIPTHNQTGNLIQLPEYSAQETEYWFVFMASPLPVLNIYDESNDAVNWSLTAFSTKEQKLFRPPIPSNNAAHKKLRGLLGGRNCSLLPRISNKHRFQPYMASSGGLICALVKNAGNDLTSQESLYNVIVFNCVTGSVKLLPPPLNPAKLFRRRPGHYLRACRLDFRAGLAQYFVLLTNLDTYVVPGFEDEYDPYAEVYDSGAGRWKMARQLEDSGAGSLKPAAEGDFFINYRESESISTVLAYHVADDAWSKAPVLSNHDDHEISVSNHITLVKCDGRLLGCSVLLSIPADSSDHQYFCGFVVKELIQRHDQSTAWVEVAKTPPNLQTVHSFYNSYPSFKAEGSLICMLLLAASNPADARPQQLGEAPLVYDLHQNIWYHLPLPDIATRFGCIAVLRPLLSMAMLSLE